MSGRAISLLVLALGWGAGWCPVYAQDGSLRVERKGPPVHEVAPGQALTVPFQVTNRGAETVRVETALELPSGWRIVSGEETFELAPGAGALRLVSFESPPQASAGVYGIRYAARNPGHAAPQWSTDSIQVRVPVRAELDLTLDQMPERMAAGESYRADLHLENLGNAPISTRIHAESSGGYPVEVQPALIDLEPGATASLSVTVHTDGELRRHRRDVLHVRALSSAPDSAHAEASRAIEITPSSRAPSDRGHELHRLPLRATVQAASSAGSVVPLELAGSGPLFDSGSERIDVLLRGPEPGASMFGERDEYRVALRSDRLDVRLGDHVYALTPLTERGRYGFGAGAAMRLGGWNAGGHYAWDRRLGRGSRSGGQIGYARGSTGVDLNYLTRTGTDAGSLWSIRGSTAPIPGARLEAEYGAGLGSGAGGTGLSVELTGRHSAFGYRFRHLHTDVDFPGSSAGTDQRSGAVDVNLRGLRISGQVARTAWQTGLKGGPSGARLNRSLRAALAYRSYGSLEYRASERAHLGSPPPRQDGSESLHLRLRWSPGRWSLSPSVEAGRTVDRLTDAAGAFRSFEVRAAYRSSGGSASASVERFVGRRFVVGAAGEGVTGRLNWSGALGERSRIRLNLVGTRHTDGTGSTHGFAEAEITRELFSGHELSARVRAHTRGRAGREVETVFVVGYSIPLNMPVSASRQWARLAGRVYDVESGEGLADVLVRVAGQEALTDSEGNLYIRGVEPGDHRLQIERSSMAPGLLPADGTALEAGARAGDETRVEIGMIRGAELSGAVRRYAPVPGSRPGDPDPETEDIGGVRNAVVELVRGDEVHRRSTDAEGRFHFSELLPGDWTVSVAADVPAWHRVDAHATGFALEPGEEEQFDVRVIPVQRTLTLIPQDSLVTPASEAIVPEAIVPEPIAPETIVPETIAREAVASEPTPPEPIAREGVAPNTISSPASRSPDGGIEDAGSQRTYTVTDRDVSLMNIARMLYDDATLWPKLWLANRDRLPSPDIVRAGHVLRVPAAAPLTRAEVTARETYNASRSGTVLGTPAAR